MKTLFIVNPAAGRGSAKAQWGKFHSLLKHNARFPFEAHYTSCAGEAEILALRAIQVGFERVIAVGGDGTINEVINAALGSHVVVGVLPFGTGNDFARSLGVTKSYAKLLHMLCFPREVLINVATLNGHHFVNAAGIGFDGLVADFVNRHRTVKNLGPLGYAVGALTVLATFAPSEATLRIDGHHLHLSDIWMIAIGNGAYYGGGMKICPQARYDDDMLDICVVANLGKVSFLKFLPTVYSGRHVEKTQFITTYRAKHIEVTFPRTMIAHADGELISTASVDIRLCEERIRFLVG